MLYISNSLFFCGFPRTLESDNLQYKEFDTKHLRKRHISTRMIDMIYTNIIDDVTGLHEHGCDDQLTTKVAKHSGSE